MAGSSLGQQNGQDRDGQEKLVIPANTQTEYHKTLPVPHEHYHPEDVRELTPFELVYLLKKRQELSTQIYNVAMARVYADEHGFQPGLPVARFFLKKNGRIDVRMLNGFNQFVAEAGMTMKMQDRWKA